MKPSSRRAAILATAAVLCAAAVLAPPEEPARGAAGHHHHHHGPIVKKRKIAPGLTYTKIVDKKIPRRTYILRMQPSKPVTLDVALARDALPARRTVLQIANANDALAAVNGDFTVPHVGRPTHPFAQDGDLLQTAVQSGPLFSLSQDEHTAYLGKPDLRITVTNGSTGTTWTLARWNQGPPSPGEIAGYSDLGGSLEPPASSACSARLLPDGAQRVEQDAIVADYTVDAVGCSETSMGRGDGVVLSAAPATDESKQLLALAPGTSMSLRWTLGWAGALDVVGGMPILVQDGRVVAPSCTTSFCRANPRTGIGYTANGGIVLVVVDGREKGSTGATLVRFAQLMKDLGAVQALNLDGGGSTTMVVQGDVVNVPSDGVQRSISNAVLVLPGRDPGEG